MNIPRRILIALALVAAGRVGADVRPLPPSASFLASALSRHARPLETPADLAPLFELIGARRVVLLGEASHGTREFYTWRAAISKALISEKRFSFIAVEGDWAAFIPVNRFVKNLPGAPESAREALLDFDRWPRWMWANEEVLELVEWLRAFNDRREPAERVGFYGIDVYGAPASLEKAPRYMTMLDADAGQRMRELFECFAPFVGDPQGYLQHVMRRLDNCGTGVQIMLQHLRENREIYIAKDAEAYLHAKQNTAIVARAEKHYRLMSQPGAGSWNARARNFHETVQRLRRHYGDDAGAIVWAHNTHVGDIRATLAPPDMENIGLQTRRELDAQNVCIVGFGTARGTVLASRQWAGARETMTLPDPLPGSLEDVLAHVPRPAMLFLMTELADVSGLDRHIGHRAIGVTYQPEHESRGNYVPTRWPARYDAFLFIADTRALNPLHEHEPTQAD